MSFNRLLDAPDLHPMVLGAAELSKQFSKHEMQYRACNSDVNEQIESILMWYVSVS